MTKIEERIGFVGGGAMAQVRFLSTIVTTVTMAMAMGNFER